MDCKRAGKTLKELALSGTAPANSPELAAHVNACSICREAFAREQAFVAAMNRGVAASVAAEPSPALRARVREQLAAPARAWEWRWAVVAAAALMAVVISFRALHSRRTPAGQSTSSPGGEVAVVAPVAPPANFAPAATTQRPNSLTRKRAGHERVALPNLPPVLIEKGEREATLRLVDQLRSGRVDAASLAVEPARIVVTELEIAPLDMPVLDVPTLDVPALKVPALEVPTIDNEADAAFPGDSR